jgi:hypothetical protein
MGMSKHVGVDIRRELAGTLSEIEAQIKEVKDEAVKQGASPYSLRNRYGYVMAPLLAAKAQTLHALVLVNQS